MNARWRYFIGGMLAMSLSSLLIYWCFSQIQLDQFFNSLKQANLIYLFMAALALPFLILANTGMWRLFIPDRTLISTARLTQVLALMIMMANLLPWGNAFAIYHLGHLEKLGKTRAFSVVTLDQVAKGFAKLSTFLFVSWLVPLPAWMKQGVLITLIGVVALFFLVLTFSYRYRNYKEGTHKNLLIDFLSHWGHHLHGLHNVPAMLGAVACGLLIKLSEIMSMYFVQRAFDVSLPWWSPIVVVAAFNLATMFPLMPGSLGVFDVSVFLVYKYMGLEPSLALTLAVVSHVVYLIGTILPGYLLTLRAGIKLNLRSLLGKREGPPVGMP